MAEPFLHPVRGPLHLGRAARSTFNRKSMAKFARLHDFMHTLEPAPAELDNTYGVTDWTMMGNDLLGDCTEATKGHMVTVFTQGKVILPSATIVGAYEAECGYNPDDPSTDQGGVITNVLDDWVKNGLGGHSITAHAEVNITQMRVQQGIWVFKTLDFGVQLPLSAQNQVGSTWDFINNNPDQPGSWGGHSTPIVKYTIDGVWFVTWGALQFATWRWVMFYADEASACISPDVTDAPVDVSQLVPDLQQIGS